jgi:hypothetical protein
VERFRGKRSYRGEKPRAGEGRREEDGVHGRASEKTSEQRLVGRWVGGLQEEFTGFERSSGGKNVSARDGMRRVGEGTIEFKDWMKPPSCQMLELGPSV